MLLLDLFFFRHKLASHGFTIVTRAGFPILSALHIHPDIIGIQRRFHSDGETGREMGGFGLYNLYGFDPVCGDRPLGCLKIELPAANP
jgi:hypothetical protein